MGSGILDLELEFISLHGSEFFERKMHSYLIVDDKWRSDPIRSDLP